ncbi:hypothetical protein H3147_20365, partial [Streptomyces sp. OF8]|nr:hypothetical protein [Streptomyces alkaliterrae]
PFAARALAADRAAPLRALAAAAPRPVASVTWDISGPLQAALTAPEGTPGRARRVAAVRVVPRPPAAPPGGGHPSPLVTSLVSWRGVVRGGHDLFGTELAALEPEAVRRGVRDVLDSGARAVAVTATGAPASVDHESALAAELLARRPDLKLCLSHESGGLGLLEREAATVLNAALLEVADRVITSCEQATEALPGSPACWFATGDGGRVTGRRLRWTPVVGLAARTAAALIGAARTARVSDAVVALTDADEITIGQVRDGLPHVETDLTDGNGIRTCLPQPVLTRIPVHTPSAATLLATRSRHTSDVVAALSPAGVAVAEALAHPDHGGPQHIHPRADLTAVGAALTEPSAWVDILVPTDGPKCLEQHQRDAEQRALGLVAAHGAEPGSAYVVRSTATAAGYLRVYRLQVRAASRTCAEVGR